MLFNITQNIMKKFILILLLIPFYSFAQQSFPLIKDDGIWRVVNGGIVTPPDPWWMIKSQYLMKGDTIINNTTYKKIYKCDYSPSINNKVYIAGIREDSSGKVYMQADSNLQLYSSSINAGQEYLLYDFSLNIGDTIILNSVIDSINIVNVIDSVLVGSEYRKRWNFNTIGGFPRQWIEGIGDYHGLFYSLQSMFENYQHISCYEDNNVFWLSPELSTDCFSVSMENVIKRTTSEVSIYPNPVGDFINLQIKDNNILKPELKIFDITGNLIKRDYLKPFADEYSLDISSLNSGMYFIKIVSSEQVISAKKFIKK